MYFCNALFRISLHSLTVSVATSPQFFSFMPPAEPIDAGGCHMDTYSMTGNLGELNSHPGQQ